MTTKAQDHKTVRRIIILNLTLATFILCHKINMNLTMIKRFGVTSTLNANCLQIVIVTLFTSANELGDFIKLIYASIGYIYHNNEK